MYFSSFYRLKRLELDYPSRDLMAVNDLGPFQWDDEPCHDSENDISDTTRPWRFQRGPPSDGGLVSLKVMMNRTLNFLQWLTRNEIIFSVFAMFPKPVPKLFFMFQLTMSVLLTGLSSSSIPLPFHCSAQTGIERANYWSRPTSCTWWWSMGKSKLVLSSWYWYSIPEKYPHRILQQLMLMRILNMLQTFSMGLALTYFQEIFLELCL